MSWFILVQVVASCSCSAVMVSHSLLQGLGKLQYWLLVMYNGYVKHGAAMDYFGALDIFIIKLLLDLSLESCLEFLWNRVVNFVF